MALNALALSITSGVQGRPFQAKINGMTTGRVEVLNDGSPGFSTVNGNVMSGGLPYPVNTVVLREWQPGVGAGYRDTRIEITAATREEIRAQAFAAIGVGRNLKRYRTAAERQPDGSYSYSIYVEDDLGATLVVPVGLLPAYTGAVSARFIIPDTLNAGVLSQMIRRADFARDDIVGGWFVYPNFYVNASGVDTAPGATRTITGSIEYPEGTLKQITFGGNPTGVAPDGAARFISDYIPISIPKFSPFWLNTRQASSAGILVSPTQGAYSVVGDKQTIGSNVADNTMVPGWAGTAGGNPYGPLFIALTRDATVVVIGDSRAQGVGNTSNSVMFPGEIMPGIGPFFGCINLSRGSVRAEITAVPANFSKRAEYLQYSSHAVLQLGTNDLANGRTASQTMGYRQAIKDYAPSLKWLHTTVGPKTTSTDSWATLAGQTAAVELPERRSFNALVRNGQPGFVGYFDLADAQESARDSGLYKAPPAVSGAITADGNHCNNLGYSLSPGYIDPGLITR